AAGRGAERRMEERANAAEKALSCDCEDATLLLLLLSEEVVVVVVVVLQRMVVVVGLGFRVAPSFGLRVGLERLVGMVRDMIVCMYVCMYVC
ncbi:hypothetical protein, partial [Escherichia coli]|uniref:hypothetical protein n=1 Tax=Escherichia coli TaxID=562 RepID=UPI001958264F